MDVHAALADPRRYRLQIEKLHEKHLATQRLHELRQSDVPLASFVLDRRTVARRIARAVERGEYRLGPAHVRTIRTQGKERVVFAFGLTDLIVHGVVAGVIDEALAPRLSARLHSYRKGASWWGAVSAFAAYARAHRRSRPDPRQRGIHVIRRDIDSYTDSIPVDPGSPVWTMLREVLLAANGKATSSESDWRLIETIVRPEAFVIEGRHFTPYRGVPTGQPISCVLFNLYLSDLDHELAAIPGAFYARYCDDLVFAHPDADTVKDAEARLRTRLTQLRLGLNEEKNRTLFLNAAGRSSASWREAKGTSVAPLLGCLVSAEGTVSLDREKRRCLLLDLEERARRTVKALKAQAPASLGPTVCAVLNRALEPRLSFSQQRSASLLRRAVTDRRDLKQLDYYLARIVMRTLSGKQGVRGFRDVSYRTMRADWKLVSLLHARNRWGRKRPAASGAVRAES